MSLQRDCFFCGKPVSFRRRMSLFCSERCEHKHRALTAGAAAPRPEARPGISGPAARADTLPPPPVPPRPRGLWRA